MTDLKKDAQPVFRIMLTVLVFACLLPSGCALIQSKKDIVRTRDTTVIVGRVYAAFPGDEPIVVAACSPGEGNEIAHYTVLHESGEYELMVDQGEYYVFAYGDKNGNLVYDAGEPAGQHDDPKIVKAPAVGVVFDVDITIPRNGAVIDIPHGTEISPVEPQKLHSRQAGDITDLDDERFSEENGSKGFWEPGSFFRQLGGNIYFLEEYDPGKTPILFIHGAGGTPRGWRYFVDHIDRTRYQPWFFYYPSGVRIDSMAYLLYWKLINLQRKYQFNDIYFTAHSMGGLVARSFIVNYGRQFPCVKLFVSLATPWGGDRMAEYGVQQSPLVIPSWIDMQPESDFIKSLYRIKMPETVNFYMFSGHKGNRNPFRSNNDGTITLSSIMDERPQTEARMNYVFNEDHASILFSSDVLAQYNAILDAFDDKKSASRPRSGGFVRVRFAYDYEPDGVKPTHTLILRPIGRKGAETVTFLTDEDNGKRLGPYPSGDYTVSMLTFAARPEKNNVPVSIESRKTTEVNFVFLPDGVIRGCVAASLEPGDRSVGMPDYRYRSADSTVRIESITLEGSGVRRKIEQIRSDEIDPEDYLNHHYLISRDDFCIDTCFGFFGLPAGGYTLTIEARGFKPIEKKYSITPGKLQYFRVTGLMPD